MRCKRKRPVAEINVVPYIDVMLVLLIIFMVTAPLLTEGVSVELPQTNAKALPSAEEMPIILSVDVNGRYYLNIADMPNEPISLEPMLLRVAATLKQKKLPVYVKGDQHVDYGKVVRAMVLLQQAGADKVGLITDSTEERT